MTTQLRKEREFYERENLLIDIAAQVLVERGYIGMTMDRIAEKAQYSKGTVYQHFTCKEDIITALHNRDLKVLHALFLHAYGFKGSTRERMQAVGLSYDWFLSTHPHCTVAMTILHSSSILEKVSEQQVFLMHGSEQGVIQVIVDIAREAVAAGELVPGPGKTPEQVILGLWALSMGLFSIQQKAQSLSIMQNLEPNRVHEVHHVLMDGYGWRPLSHEYDTKAVDERVVREVIETFVMP